MARIHFVGRYHVVEFTKYTFAAGTGTGSTRTHQEKPSTGSIAVVLIWGGGGAGGRDGGVGLRIWWRWI